MVIKILATPGNQRSLELRNNTELAVQELREEGIVTEECEIRYLDDMSWTVDYGAMNTPVLIVEKSIVSIGRELSVEEVKSKLLRHGIKDSNA
ncbi:MAG: hypothetical protein J5935_00085 [Lachnospiraceae bacterium]|nr:hypothetical protein [Lachnospiraceae bacterium]